MINDREPRPLSRRQRFARTAVGGMALGLGTVAYAWRVEPHWVAIRHVRMPLQALPESLVGKRLVQISDLHVGPVVDNGYLRRVLRRLPELEPDYLVITGDFMTSQLGEQIDATLDTLHEAPIDDAPTIGILGNHDYGDRFRSFAVADRLTEGLESLGVRVLRNESTEVDGLQFTGCDDLWTGRCYLSTTFESMAPGLPTICLAHNPDTVDFPHFNRFSGWILSGHTHGGQCRFPFFGAPVLPIRNQRYSAGHFKLSGGRDLYVNRGLGYKRRVRFGVRPEITVFTLEAS